MPCFPLRHIFIRSHAAGCIPAFLPGVSLGCRCFFHIHGSCVIINVSHDSLKQGEILYRVLIVVLLFFCIQGNTLQGREYRDVEVKKLLSSTTAGNGQKLVYLRTDNPEVTALLVGIPPGGQTGWHQHPVPVYAYVLEGRLTVAMKDGTTFSFTRGEAVFEVINTLHNGYNYGSEPVSLVVFYTGAVGVPNVVRENPSAVPALP